MSKELAELEDEINVAYADYMDNNGSNQADYFYNIFKQKMQEYDRIKNEKV